MPKTSKNTNLNSAKKEKNDEFYTQLTDIANELRHYRRHFQGKTVLCNCDDPRVSNFFRYFFSSFCDIGLKKLIAVCYKNLNPDLFSQHKDEQAVYCIYDGKGRTSDMGYNLEEFLKQNEWGTLKGDGDFRTDECIELLKQADIVVTNPPFSLFREYVAQLIEYGKKFVIVGHQNAITYKEIFPLIKSNKIWLGYGFNGMAAHFINVHYEDYATAGDHQEGMIRVSGVHWFTNLEIDKRYDEMTFYKIYTPEEFPKYDNYDAIEVSKTMNIPTPESYDGIMGVPITFLDKYNPEQFEIIGNLGCYAPDGYSLVSAIYVGKQKIFKRIAIRHKKGQNK
ncbi:putative adenine-specific methylase [Planctomycetales bacterium]|nr:putative adenine-specific methylase [Planctomycetales bacterium]